MFDDSPADYGKASAEIAQMRSDISTYHPVGKVCTRCRAECSNTPTGCAVCGFVEEEKCPAAGCYRGTFSGWDSRRHHGYKTPCLYCNGTGHIPTSGPNRPADADARRFLRFGKR